MWLVTEPHRALKLRLKLATASSRIATRPLSSFKSCSSISRTIEQAKEEKKEQTLNLFLHDISRTMTTDLKDYKIIKEGEAEILMHAKNEVFYNKAQVMRKKKVCFFKPFSFAWL